jgi:DNA repair protein RadC
MAIADLPAAKRPCDKLLELGVEALSEYAAHSS